MWFDIAGFWTTEEHGASLSANHIFQNLNHKKLPNHCIEGKIKS